MDLDKLINIQNSFDAKHGWVLKENPSIQELFFAINEDLIGLFGEIGEFANIVKKVNLTIKVNNNEETKESIIEYKNQLSEELIDSFIYLIRIANHLNIDITDCYLKKLEYNKIKYEKYNK